MSINERQRKAINLLLDIGKGNFLGGLTTRKYVSINKKISRATAFREISDLMEKKMLIQNPSKGRSVTYDLNWPSETPYFTSTSASLTQPCMIGMLPSKMK